MLSRYSDWLRAGRPGDRIPVAARFSALVQTGHGAHPASCTIGTGSFPGGKERPGHDADPSPPSSAIGHERVELYLYSSFGPYGLYRASVPVQGVHFTLPLQHLLSMHAHPMIFQGGEGAGLNNIRTLAGLSNIRALLLVALALRLKLQFLFLYL